MSQEAGSSSTVATVPSARRSPSAEIDHEAQCATVYCELSDNLAFGPYATNRPHVPVLANFGAGRMHMCSLRGSWDLERAVAEQAAALFRSVNRSDDGKPAHWDELTFQFGPRAFLYASNSLVIAYATSPREAAALAKKFVAAYQKPPKATGGAFHLIKSGREISSEIVPLNIETILSNDTFCLHYGAAAWVWHQAYKAKLHAKHHGLTILEGPPGTGKTSYLRHLMGELRESHRFYFVPPATLDVLSSPDFIGFWAEQRRLHSEQRFAVILEDADGALMTRANDNHAHVSAILNLSDGMLADFLRLQIICTINCRAADIDQALLRPGRLVSHNIFRRLDLAEASRLAESLGRRLGDVRDYSLAEIFAGKTEAESGPPRIGFAAHSR